MNHSPIAEKKAITQLDKIVEKLTQYADTISFSTLNPAAIHEAKRRLIDSIGCAFGAYLSEPAKIARIMATTVQAEHHGASVVGLYHQTSPEMAAYANGMMFRYLDYNDTYLSLEPAHPSDNIAAILPVAELMEAKGEDIITAIVLAYEIQCRLCDASSIRARGWDHVTYGALSATLAAAKVMGLNKVEMKHAMAIAGTTNINLRQTRIGELSHWKGAAFANVSMNAVFAARLAGNGMTGPSHLFEGERGLIQQVTGPLELGHFGGTAGEDFMINKTYIKYWPAEYHSQSAIDAALQLRNSIGSIDNIESILIESFDAAVDIIGGEEEKWFPKSRETADHSMPYCVAAALMDGDIWMDSFDEKHLNNPQLIALIQKIRMARSEDCNKGYPKGIPNHLKITLKDGTIVDKMVTYPRGHAGNPMTDEEVELKFRRLSEPYITKHAQDEILDTLWHLEQVDDLDLFEDIFASCVV